MTLELLIAETNAAGFRIHGLFQLSNPWDKHKWRACINDGQHCWEFGEAETPYQALLNAIEKATTTNPIPLNEVKPSVIVSTSGKTKKLKNITLDDL